MDSLRKIEGNLKFLYKFTFCTLVTNIEEYNDMVESAKKAHFVGHDIEYLYFNNKDSNQFDGFNGINRAIKEANGEYLIFCHQDILFSFDTRDILENRINELEEFDAKWAVAGNAGVRYDGKAIMRISDPNNKDIQRGEFPGKVISLDENFLVINRKQSVYCSTGLSGFHLYGTDLCQNAIDLGLSAYAINFHLLHKSAGNIDDSFYLARSEFIKFYNVRKKYKVIWTMCTVFYVSSSVFNSFIYRFKFIIELDKKINKYFKKKY